MSKLKIFQFVDMVRSGLDLDQAEHIRQCKYAVVATSREAVVRETDAVGMKVTIHDLATFATAMPPSDLTLPLLDRPEKVFYRELRDRGAEWRPVPALVKPAAFAFRATGPDIFQVDAGTDHLGTVQKFNSHEWWAYPALSNGSGTSYIRRTREDAAEALRAHHQATAPAEDHGRRQESGLNGGV